MHKQLEDYLTEVANSLRSLPTARRNDELKEMRQHLLNAVIVSQEMGQTEDQAAASAVEQFGTPDELSKGILWAWKRDVRKQSLRSYFMVTGVWGIFYIRQCYEYPHEIARIILFFISFMFGVGMLMLLPPKYVLSSLVFKRGLPDLVWSRLITAVAVSACAVGFFSMPHPLSAYLYPPLGDIALVFIFWCWRCEIVVRQSHYDTGDVTGSTRAA